MEALIADPLLRVLSFLSAAEIGRCACTSSRLAAACTAPEVWQSLLARDFDPGSEDRLTACSAAAYSARVNRFRAQLAARARIRDRFELMQQAAKTQTAVGLNLSAVGIAGAVLSPYVLLLALVASVAATLDAGGGGQVVGGWAVTLLPAWLLVAISCGWVALVGCLARANPALVDTSPWFGQLGRLSGLPCHGAIVAVVRGRPIIAAAVCIFSTLVFAQICLLCARISVADPGAFTWALTALPFWLLAVGLAAGSVAALRMLSREKITMLAAAWCVVGCPVIITAVLLVVALDTASADGLGIPLRLVLVPLWAVGG